MLPQKNPETRNTPDTWRAAFPALAGKMNGKPLAFLDSGASAQKPQIAIDAMAHALRDHYANIHRGIYDYSQTTTAEFEAVRGKVAAFINASSDKEIVFTRNATESINLVAHCWGRANLQAGDEIILTGMEHHANLVPWHMLRDALGFTIKYIPLTDAGDLDLAALDALLTPKTKLLSFVHVSNALGTINPAAAIAAKAKAYNPDIHVLVDGSQAVVHMATDVQALGCDWFVFTGHKLYGPTGVGVLWGRADVLNAMPPYQGGGDMIERVTLAGSTYQKAPQRFEAGTPAIAEVIGLGAAIDFVTAIGMDAIGAHEAAVAKDLLARLAARPDVRVYGQPRHRAGIVSFSVNGASPADIGMILDQCGVAVRTGHHCCQPLMGHLGVEGTIRASLALYNNTADIDALEAGLDKARRLLA